MTEETFGPTLPIMKVADEDEAVRLANDSIYGLAGSVFGRDTAHAEAVARRLDTGAVCVNDAIVNYFALELPMGGAKASGLGSRHGAGGIRKYCSQQAILVTPRALARKKDLTMFPYKARTSQAARGGVQAACTAAANGTSQVDRIPRAGPRAARSSSGIVVSALVWWTVAMPSFSAGVRLKGRSST